MPHPTLGCRNMTQVALMYCAWFPQGVSPYVEEWRQGCPRGMRSGSRKCLPCQTCQTNPCPQIQSSGVKELGGIQTRWSCTWGNRLASEETSGQCLARSSQLLRGHLLLALWSRIVTFGWPQPLGKRLVSPHPSSSALPSCPSSRPPLLSMLLWALRVFFSPAVLPELGSHSISVKMM